MKYTIQIYVQLKHRSNLLRCSCELVISNSIIFPSPVLLQVFHCSTPTPRFPYGPEIDVAPSCVSLQCSFGAYISPSLQYLGSIYHQTEADPYQHISNWKMAKYQKNLVYYTYQTGKYFSMTYDMEQYFEEKKQIRV